MGNDIYWVGIGDIHEQIDLIKNVGEFAAAQAVLIAGDITNIGNRKTAHRVLKTIEAINPHIYAQIGNMDTEEVHALLTEKQINIHASSVMLGHGVGLLGLGYSTPTPFHTPSEVSETQLASWLDQAYGKLPSCEHLVLMSHMPPHGTKTDVLYSGQSVGSKAVRDFIESRRPAICLCGHIHEAKGVDAIGDTQIINPGVFARGGYAVIRLTEDGLTATLKHIVL